MRSIWPRISLDKCCALFGYCRQAYYKHPTVKDFDTEAANELIVQSVRQHREMMPRIGSRKLYVLAQHELGKPCWRTSGQTPREVDFIEIVDGKMRAFECKLSPKTKSKVGKVFFNAYPDCPVETLTPRDLMRLWQEDETIEYK